MNIFILWKRIFILRVVVKMSTMFGNWALYSVPDDELDEKEFHD